MRVWQAPDMKRESNTQVNSTTSICPTEQAQHTIILLNDGKLIYVGENFIIDNQTKLFVFLLLL